MKKSIELKVGGIYTEVLLDDATPKDLYDAIMNRIVQNPRHPEFSQK